MSKFILNIWKDSNMSELLSNMDLIRDHYPYLSPIYADTVTSPLPISRGYSPILVSKSDRSKEDQS